MYGSIGMNTWEKLYLVYHHRLSHFLSKRNISYNCENGSVKREKIDDHRY